MAGKKRKTKASSSSKGSAASAPAASAEGTAKQPEEDSASPVLLPASPLLTLLRELHQLALDQSGNQCHQTLQALADGSSPVLGILAKEGTTTSTTTSLPVPATAASAAAIATSTTEASLGSSSKKKKRVRASTASSDSSRAVSAAAAKTTTNTTAKEEQGGYWILLATHVLNRLMNLATDDDNDDDDEMKDESSSNKKEKAAQMVALISFFLARILLSSPENSSKSEDRAVLKLLERACANHARSLLGRAILSISIGSTWALEQLTNMQQDDGTTTTNNIASMEYWIPAALALDSVVRLSHQCPKAQQALNLTTSNTTITTTDGSTESYPLQFWNQSQHLLEEKAMSILTRENPKKHLESICGELSLQGSSWQWEEYCLAALLGISTGTIATAAAAVEEVTVSPPPTKRTTNRRGTRKKSTRTASASSASGDPDAPEGSASSSGTPPSPLVQAFSALINNNTSTTTTTPTLKQWNHMRIDGRVAVKRWAAMAIVWLFKGHMRVLEASLGMLKNRLVWQSQVWESDDDAKINSDEEEEETRKKSKKTSDNESPQEDCIELPGNTALVALVSRLLGIVTESQAQSGSRAPTGGLEAYVKAIAPRDDAFSSPSEAATPTKKSLKSKAPKIHPPDLRSIAMVVLYHFLQAHEDCLEINYINRSEVSVVNDENNYNPPIIDASGKIQYTHSPVIHRLVQGLARVAAASCSTQLSFLDQNLETERIERISAALVLQNMNPNATTAIGFEDLSLLEAPVLRHRHPIDAQLVNLALSQLSDCLRKVDRKLITPEVAATSNNDQDEEDNLVAHFRLEEPLPIPDIPGSSGVVVPLASAAPRRRSSKASGPTAAVPLTKPCSFAGIFGSDENAPEKDITEEDLLSLFLRAVIPPTESGKTAKQPGKRKQKKKQPKRQSKDEEETPTCPTMLYSTVIDILKRCYDNGTKEPLKDLSGGKGGGKKKRGSSTGKGSARKRRRISEAGEAEETASDAASSAADQESVTKQQGRMLTATRATLAEEATNVLRVCVSTAVDKAADNGYNYLAGKLRQAIRDAISIEQIVEIVELTESLDDMIIAPRSSGSEQTSLSISLASFTSSERALWMSHLNLCVVIGRGYFSPEENDGNPTCVVGSILRDANARLTLFQSIAKTQVSDNRWPLWLPTALSALVTSNMTYEADITAVNGQNVTPERYIVDGFWESIKKAFEDLESIATTRYSRPFVLGDRTLVEYGIPLSIQDARLIMVAFGRLSPLDRNKILPKIMASTQAAILRIITSENLKSIVCENREISGFIARVITLCSNLTVWTSCPGLWKKLNDFTGRNPPSDMPSFVSGCDWYRSERCYMGLFSDWESAVPPILSDESAVSVALASAVVAKELASMLELSFQLGFLASKNDRGHLLFSAWNAIGNMPIWDPKRSSDISRNSSLEQLLAQSGPQGEWQSLPHILLQIRDEICKLYVDVQGIGGRESSGLTLALKLAETREKGTLSASQIKKSLKMAINTGEKFLTTLLERRDEPIALFSTLEALAVYITFAVASHTKPGDDMFSNASAKACLLRRKRARGYSTESDIEEREQSEADVESVDSDDSDEEDPATKLQSKLHDACCDLGAAPTHPDWLDKKCRLQPGMASSEALDAARTALRVLSKLLQTSFSRHKKFMKNALTGILKQQRSDPSDTQAILAMKLIVLLRRYESDSRYPGSCLEDLDEDEGYETAEYLASIFNVDEDLLGDFLKQGSPEHFMEAKEAWCPNSAQRILGRFHSNSSDTSEGWLGGCLDAYASTAELRVDGQWEVLLGTALASSCRAISHSTPTDLSSEVIKDLASAESWRGVCETAISCLMPAAALLRFGLARNGRETHPLSLEEEQSAVMHDNLFLPFHISERLPATINASKQLRDQVAGTLALLARYCAQSAGDSPTSLTCHAVATNLMVDGKSFEDLRGFETARFAFTTLSELHTATVASAASATNDSVVARSLPFVNQQLTGLIEFWSRRNVLNSETGKSTAAAESPTALDSDLERLVAVLGLSSCKVDTICESEVSTSGMLALLDRNPYQNMTTVCSPLEAQWRWGDRHEPPLISMVSLLCSEASRANLQTRACLAMILSRLACGESTSPAGNTSNGNFIGTALVKAFNAVDEERYRSLLGECVQMADESNDGKFQKEVCTLLALLLGARTGQTKFSRIDVTVAFLIEGVSDWLGNKSKGREHILDLLFLYSSRTSSLSQVGSILLSAISSSNDDSEDGVASDDDLEPVARYFRFLQLIRPVSTRKGKSKDPPGGRGNAEPSRDQSQSNKEDLSKKAAPPHSCSYAMKSGFHGQHWYNCYDCGLTWDKGCCSLCALVCHKGHDVSYSRYSSFFCDCGAESEEDRSRSSCKCLTTLPKDNVQELFENEGWVVPSDSKQGHRVVGKQTDRCLGAGFGAPGRVFVDIAKENPKQVRLSLDNLISEANKLGWLESLFEVLRTRFDVWSSSCEKKKTLQDSPALDFEPEECEGFEFLRQSFQRRIGKALEIEPLTTQALVPIRAAKSNSFQVKFSGTTSERLKRSKNEITRVAVAADTRGRLVIAEPCSLLFCSMASSVNMKHVTDVSDIPLSRSSMCILGSATVRFNIVGMRFCTEHDRHLLVWGTSEANILFLNDAHNGIDRSITLSLDLDPTECSDTDYVVKCGWIPGSQTCVAIGCGRFISIFDAARADSDNRALPVVSFGLGLDANLRDIEITPAHAMSQTANLSCDSRPEAAATLFIMLENGRLYSVDLEYDAEGKPTARGEQQFETSESVSLPLAGVRAYGGSTPGLLGAQQKTLGDGSSLTYLSQSHLLLYKATSSCVLALTLGITGKITGSVALLPHICSPELLGTASSGGYSIGGPYTHWTELGMSQYDDGSRYFRVACVGRSWRTNQPKLLCVEFNETATKVKEISWEPDSIGLGLSLYSSFEGLCAFSLPFRCENSMAPDSNDGSRFAERAFLCAVTSNGCMLIYGEETGLSMSSAATVSKGATDDLKSQRKSKNETKSVPDRSILANKPITLFERLKPVSDELEDEIVFGGDGLGADSKEIKRKLSRDNSVFLISPRREGCTITISIKPAAQTDSKADQTAKESKKSGPRDLAIAAVRVLVGSTSSDCIPKKLFVQGRPIQLTSGRKKWYSITLTDEEIALTVRTGVLGVGFSSAFDSTSNPLIDAMEVYAIDRQEVNPWLPRTLAPEIPETLEPSEDNEDARAPRALVLALRSLEALCDLVGPVKSLPKSESDLLKCLVREIIVNRNKLISDCIEDLLRRLYPNAQARNSIKDEGALQGCSLLLSRCQILLESTKDADDGDSTASADFDNAWFTVRALLRSSLRTSSYIARCRPINYLRASDILAQNKVSSGSIAVDSSKLLSEGIQRSLPCEDLCELFTQVGLAESAIAANTDIDQGERLASFIIVRKLLESENLAVVERACHAISSFCRKYGAADQGRERTNDLFAALQAARIVCYQCDNCGKVPITGVRYTLLEDDHDIDLCKNCFRLGSEFAESNDNKEEKVVINEKPLNLTCALIKMMQPVPIVKADVTEASDLQTNQDSSTQDDDAVDEDDEELQMQKALALSLGNVDEDRSNVSSKVDQSYESFVNSIFSNLLELLSNALAGHRGGPRFGLMLSLLIDLVHHSSEDGGKLSRARKVAAEISHGASRLITAAGKSSKDFQRSGRLTLIMSLRALAYLLVPEIPGQVPGASQPDEAGKGASPKAAVDTREVKCDVHGVQAARRRCARGEHKDRRFYVCGMERRQRCKFFVWADQVGQQQQYAPEKRSVPKSKFNKDVAGCLWSLFSKSSEAGKEPLHLQLCGFIESILAGWKSGGSARLTLSIDSEADKEEFLKPSLYDGVRARADFCDGVFCSKAKLQDASMSAEAALSAEDASKPSIAVIADSFYADGEIKLVEASLELLALIANHETDGIEHWFSLLCEIIGSPQKSAHVRCLAKKVLKQLCAGKRDLYHSVRDHFVFGFQIKSLLHNTQKLLRMCLLLKEKARQSGPHWRHGSVVKWENLQAGGLIGSDNLISEDCSSLQSDRAAGEILEELWGVAKSRGENWRHFCGLTTLPNSHQDTSSEGEDGILGTFRAPAPVVSLLWIACSLSGTNQIKALKLVDLALTHWKEKKKPASRPNGSCSEDDENAESDAKGSSNSTWLKAESSSPEDILLNGARKLTLDDFHAFMMHFAYRGRSAELRKVACSITQKLMRKVRHEDVCSLMGRLLGEPLCQAGQLGKNSVELLNVLQGQLRVSGRLPVEVTNLSDAVLFYFIQQFQAIKHDRANGEYVCIESSSGSLRKRFDLSSCVHCHYNSTMSSAKEASKKSTSRATPARATSSSQRTAAGGGLSLATANTSSTQQVVQKREWLPGQVSPFSRGRLDSSKESTTNNAFATMRKLNGRLAISEVHVSVNDPRGRFVKTITVYFTPRPVNEVSVLKSEEYADKWQRCATMSLTRGASRTSVTLPVPVVAANLKIEFTDFYERPGGSKAADGSLLVHCPRCTRVVSNAHGVCGNCGEVAFQCRKCRHINYDQLQSFLCVECGFCSAGSFSFDLVAGVATNAVAITNDDDYERANRMLNAAKRLHEDLREALREKLRALIQSRKPKDQQENTNMSSFLVTPSFRRSFQGQDAIAALTSIGQDGSERVGKKGWAVKTIATPNTGGVRVAAGGAAADRTRSLLRLARQIRNDSGSTEQRRNGDVIIRQLSGRGGASIEALDGENDLLNLLEGTGGSLAGLTGSALGGPGASGILDASDPLSRLLSSFQTSRERSRTSTRASSNRAATGAGGTSGSASAGARASSGGGANAGGTGGAGLGGPSMSKKQAEAKFTESLDECEKLHVLMREAERECYELDRRVQAWKRLERDELADSGSSSLPVTTTEGQIQHRSTHNTSFLAFSPSHCSTCSGAVAVQLLVLWLRLFQADPSSVIVSQEFIVLLLEENIHLSKNLVDLKRTVVREIATKAPVASSKLVLDELGKRVRIRDVSCAEILGKIIELGGDFALSQDYVNLAMDVLQRESSLKHL